MCEAMDKGMVPRDISDTHRDRERESKSKRERERERERERDIRL